MHDPSKAVVYSREYFMNRLHRVVVVDYAISKHYHADMPLSVAGLAGAQAPAHDPEPRVAPALAYGIHEQPIAVTS